MTTKKLAAALAVVALTLPATGCQGGTKAPEFTKASLEKIAAMAGTSMAADTRITVEPDGMGSGVVATMVNGAEPRVLGINEGDKDPKQVAVAVNSADGSAVFDVNSLDLAALTSKAQEYAKAKCAKGAPATITVKALTAKARYEILTCLESAWKGPAEATLDGKPLTPPDPSKPAEFVPKFLEYVAAYGGQTTTGINIERRADGFNMSWHNDHDHLGKNLTGATCLPSLGWFAEATTPETGQTLRSSCLPAGPWNGAPVPMSSIEASGLTKVIEAAGSTYYVALMSRDGKPVWAASAAKAGGGSTYYDLAGNKLPA